MMSRVIERVQCPYCGVGEGSHCQTSSGDRAREPHGLRWAALMDEMRYSRYVVRVLTDDEHIGVKAGEEFIAETYWLDPGKVTLLRSVWDGRDPQCNEYRSNVEWVRWVR